ncbi:hypothetical protein GCM10020358_21460 [Amorphoplanes nipponensis]|uniref:hypothetical protein n=1 Tax=Actinoplanes nipponensis TaxID=135950 RepID=UPI0031EE9598
MSCCPTNLARTFASLAAYLATADDGGIQLHQYAAATLNVSLPGDRPVELEVDTDYPATGRVTVRVLRSPDDPWTLTLRVPPWAAGATVTAGGHRRAAAPGWVRVERRFRAGETVVLDLPVGPRLTEPDPRIDAVRGCVAVERGPVVLCAESVDLPPGARLDALRLERDGGLVAGLVDDAGAGRRHLPGRRRAGGRLAVPDRGPRRGRGGARAHGRRAAAAVPRLGRPRPLHHADLAT